MSKFRNYSWLALLALLSFPCHAAQRPDVVFIIVDDLNDWIGCLEGHPDTKTPHIDALASRGMLFSQAYCNAPQCQPSRTSLNSGIYPFNNGVYFNAANTPVKTVPKTPTLQQFFRDNGYLVASGGKVHHGGPGGVGDNLLQRPRDPKPPKELDKFGGLLPPSDGFPLDTADETMGDYKVASWAIKQWNQLVEQPLFMSVGFYRPHRPLQVPAPWFDRYPLESINRPLEPMVDDWNDMPLFARMLARSHAHKPMHQGRSDHEFIVETRQWDATIQAYLASIAFVDAQIGRLLNALQENPRGRETIVMLVSDHGWHLGEKKHWCKGAIWEQTTHIPFIVQASGVQSGSVCVEPVSLIDIYPSLVDLAGFNIPDYLDGNSVKPQLYDPTIKRSPVISSYGAGNTAIRSRNWRYIRYEDGSEELYDHRVDPNEWKNLAADTKYEHVKKRLSTHIPDMQAPSVKVQSWFDRYQKVK